MGASQLQSQRPRETRERAGDGAHASLASRWRGISGRARRWAGLCAALFLVGCSTTRQLPLDAFPAGGTGQARVFTHDGYSYDFERVNVRGDSLIGTYFVVEERLYGPGELAYVDVERHTILPLAKVAQVEIKRVDLGNTLLLGAGATLFVIWARSVIEPEETDAGSSSGGGKPPPGGGP